MRQIALSFLMLALAACGSGDRATALADASTCAAPATFAEIQKAIFEDARKNFLGNVKYVNDIDNLLKASVYNPILQDINKDTGKADCQGRLTFNVPAALSEHFGRESSLTADIGYTVQPSADGSGFVYTVGGYNDVLQMILAAASSLEEADQSGLVRDRAVPTDAKTRLGGARRDLGPAVAAIPSATARNVPPADVCYDLWYQRNQIYAQNGYCFRSRRGQSTFGNDGCYTNVPRLPASQQREVAAIQAEERRLACAIN